MIRKKTLNTTNLKKQQIDMLHLQCMYYLSSTNSYSFLPEKINVDTIQDLVNKVIREVEQYQYTSRH